MEFWWNEAQISIHHHSQMYCYSAALFLHANTPSVTQFSDKLINSLNRLSWRTDDEQHTIFKKTNMQLLANWSVFTVVKILFVDGQWLDKCCVGYGSFMKLAISSGNSLLQIIICVLIKHSSNKWKKRKEQWKSEVICLVLWTREYDESNEINLIFVAHQN